MKPSERIEAYAAEHDHHVQNWQGTCDPLRGDRCDITAAYRHAAKIARASE